MKKNALKIKKAKHSGFCFGVKRAIGIADDFLKKNKEAYSIGPIIHNPLVVKEFSKRGLKVISGIEAIKKKKDAKIVIRSHGLSPHLKNRLLKLSVATVDATCPFVKRSHKIVSLLKKEGYTIVIAGEKNHPEIKALSEAAGPECMVVTQGKDLIKSKIKNKKIAVIAQTTLNREDYIKIINSIFNMDCLEYRIFDTICNDVAQRQSEAKKLAGSVGAVVVVGGKTSANTRYLAKICKDAGTKTYHVESEKDIGEGWFEGSDSIGIISGASTPDKIVNKVILRLKNSLKFTA